MSDDVLIRFLSNGLVDVGGDDAKLEKLQSTAADLAQILEETPSKAMSFALVAYDPSVPVSDPVVQEALEVLKKRWATYVNTFASTPVSVVRAMLLDALKRAADTDDRVAVAFAATARNALPLMNVGNEKSIWADVLSEVERAVDARAEKEWETPESIKVPQLSFKPSAAPAPKLEYTQVDRQALATAMQAAAGPQSQNRQTGGNPTWPQNNPAQWAHEFGLRLSEAVAHAVDTAGQNISVSGIDVSKPLSQLSTAVTTYVEETLKAFSGATAGLQRRTGLLWWKEALYSPSAGKSYRDIEPEAAAALMALDLSNQVPTFSPASVSTFLNETVSALMPKSADRPIFDLVEFARESPQLGSLRSVAATLFSSPQGRGPLLALIAHTNAPTVKLRDNFNSLVGIGASTPISLSGWATWLFRELQAAKAAKEQAPKPRVRKAPAQ